jgi:uncharacterized caspase-like protein
MNSRGLAQLAYEKGMSVLTAAQGYQPALEATELGHGLLAYALNEWLDAKAADRDADGSLTVREWFDYASARVPELHHAMVDAARVQRGFTLDQGERHAARVAGYSIQRPRVFYRSDPEVRDLVVVEAHEK